MNVQRLRQMSLPEIAGRTRQQASKWWDRLAANGLCPARAGGADESRAQLLAFRQGASRRFFAGAVDPRTPTLLRACMPEHARERIDGAERVLRGRFDLLGYRGLSFGEPTDWHFDPIAQRRAPLVHWTLLDPLDTVSLGDSKVVWELNRHQWLVKLAQAYRLTRDERFIEGLAAYVTDWLRSNPSGRGINWASSLELAFRLIAWCFALALLRDSPALDPGLFARMRAAIEEQAAHVEKYLSRYFSPNTHLTGEALGLFYVGTLFPDLGRAGRWRERGARILAEECSRQVLEDGVYFEQSTCYQRYTVEIYLHLILLAGRNGISLPAEVGETTQRMVDVLITVRRPDGSVPQIGDSDGGWLLPLADRGPEDFRGVFSVAAAVFGRADYAWAAGGLTPETVWLLGAEGVDRLAALRPAPPSRDPSRLLREGGYAVMRSDWRPAAHHLVFDVGPLGCPASAGHGHADLLSIQCSAFGQLFLVDSGTGTYGDQRWRTFFRSTAAHSTVMVDGASQATPAGPFAWRQRPRARLRRWLSTDAFDLADAEHDAYLGRPGSVRHRRQVLFVKPRFWVVLDELEGAGRHQVDLRFQFAPVEVRLGPGTWTRASSGGRGLLVRPFATVPLHPRLRHGGCDPIEGWVSADYGHWGPAPMVVYSATVPVPVRVLTLLLPIAQPATPLPPVSPLVREERGLIGLVFGGGEETVVLGPDGLLAHAVRAPLSQTFHANIEAGR